MKKLFNSKAISMIVVALVLINIMAPLKAEAAVKKDFKYLALGDSIATGYGLEGYVPGTEQKDSYTSLVKSELGATSMTNLAIDGMNSTQLLGALDSATKGSPIYESVVSAKIVTLTIGSNDVLQPFLGILAKEFGGEVKDLNTIITNLMQGGEVGQLELISKFENLNKETTGLRNNPALNQGVNNFANNFPRIIEKIKTISPNTEIYVTNIYNPYKDVDFKSPLDQTSILDLDAIVEEYTEKLNNVFINGSLNYSVIDIDDKFEKAYTGQTIKHPLVNVDMAKYNFDPHPNAMGHKLIADNVTSYIKENSTNYKLNMIDNTNLKIFVNGKQLNPDLPSKIVNDRALVSIRAISEALDAKVEWNQKTQTVIIAKDNKDNKQIKLQIGNKKAYLDGKEVILDSEPILNRDITLVPVRFIAESFGANVGWDNQTRTVIIQMNK